MLLLAAVAFTSKAQVFFEESFELMPPVNWTIDDHVSNWDANASANAGGTAPEGRFTWDPSFVGESHLYSPEIDLTGYSMVSFSFLHMIDHYGGNYTVGIATRSGGGEWNTVWEKANPSGSIPAEEVEISITNNDVGQADFQICFFFSGDSYNINYWYFDNAKLFIPNDHDVATKSILGDTYFAMGDDYIANALIKNVGLNEESFDVVLEITDGTTDGVLFTDTKNITLGAGQETTLAFNTYTLPYENFVYEVSVATMLSGDEDPANDMKSKYIYTYTSAREMVVVEIGTGTWCGYCPGAAMGADDLIANNHNVAIMEHHNGDDYANQYSDARNNYYGVTGYPTATFDGVEQFVGGSATASMYPNYLPIVNGRNDIMSAFSCEIFGENTGGNDYTVKGVINKLGPAMNENVVFHIGLTESHIPEIWGNQDHLNFVTRLMLPDENGTTVDVVNNDYIEIDETFQLNEGWDVDECELVFFLQDNDTKEILQGGKVMLNALIPVGINEELAENGLAIQNIYPNPFSGKTNICFSLAENENVRVSIHDMTGREVDVLANENMLAGEHKLLWEAGSELPSGIYFCIISSENHTITRKVMLNK